MKQIIIYFYIYKSKLLQIQSKLKMSREILKERMSCMPQKCLAAAQIETEGINRYRCDRPGLGRPDQGLPFPYFFLLVMYNRSKFTCLVSFCLNPRPCLLLAASAASLPAFSASLQPPSLLPPCQQA